MSVLVNPYRYATAGGGAPAYLTSESLSAVNESAGTYTDALSTTFLGSQLQANKTYLGIWTAQVTSTSTASASAQLLIAGVSQEVQNPNLAKVTTPIDQLCYGHIFQFQPGASPANTAFEVQFKRGASGTATMSNTRLSLLKLGADDFYSESLTRVTTTSTTLTTGASITFTPATAGDYIIICTFDTDHAVGGPVGVALTDGTTSTGEVTNHGANSNNTEKVPGMLILQLTGVSGAKTVNLQYRSVASSTSGLQNMRFCALRKDRYANVYTTALGADNTGTETTYTDALSQTFTPAAADHLLVGAWNENGSVSGDSVFSLLDDGGTTTEELICDPNSGTSANYGKFGFAHRIATYAASSRTQRIRRHGQTTTTARVRAGARIATLSLAGLT
jgi:hypothetical protein